MAVSSNTELAFVIPRYYSGIAGGAETLISTLAGRAALLGYKVSILTTCAKDNRTWENYFPEGREELSGMTVHRFAVDIRDLEKWIPLQVRISHELPLTIDEQLIWLRESVNSKALYEYLVKEGHKFEKLFFGPYLFGTTFWGSQIYPDRSILIPCLHDESYAYLDCIASMFRRVCGCLFNAQAEGELVQFLYGKIEGYEVGMGFQIPGAEWQTPAPLFNDKFPYLVYLGRKETGKNVQVLIDYFCDGKDSGRLPKSLKLVIAGGGSFADILRPNAAQRTDIIDLEHLSEADKQRLIAHSLCLIQPSKNESFSIVLMESWLLRVPVIVHAHCPVTKEHVLKASAGLYFADQADFIAALNLLYTDRALAAQLGNNGHKYVSAYYSWSAVEQRFTEALKKFATKRHNFMTENCENATAVE